MILHSLGALVCCIVSIDFVTFGLLILALVISAIMHQTASCYDDIVNGSIEISEYLNSSFFYKY